MGHKETICLNAFLIDMCDDESEPLEKLIICKQFYERGMGLNTDQIDPGRIKGSNSGQVPSSHQVGMLRLVVLLSLVALTLACQATTTAGGAAGGGGAGGGGAGGGGAGGGGASSKTKREVHEAEVVVVTHQNYDPELTNSYMGVIKSAIEQHAQEEGVMTDHSLIDEKPGNIGGKFAVTYAVVDVECNELKNFITGAKEKSAIINYVTVTCDGQETLL